MYAIVQRHDKNDRNIEELEKMIIFFVEKALKLAIPSEEKIIFVFDLSNFTLKNMDYEAVKLLVNTLQNNYQVNFALIYKPQLNLLNNITKIGSNLQSIDR